VKQLQAHDKINQDYVMQCYEDIGDREILLERAFLKSIAIERKRSERSKESFLLMILEIDRSSRAIRPQIFLEEVAVKLLSCTRGTDIIGWYKEQCALGVLYTGINLGAKKSALNGILNRISAMLGKTLQLEQLGKISISFHVFPDDWGDEDTGGLVNTALYPDLIRSHKKIKISSIMKRVVDIAVSAALLISLAPLFIAIAAAIKITSRGNVLFKQQRVGQFGKHFTFLKFRSMRTNNDVSEHREYVTKLIANQIDDILQGVGGDPIYKLTNDSRVTWIGKILRRTSLDELPQIINVLCGEMSLVGPRPPIPYELDAYQIWHRRRVLESKPGITGLWQVKGRSRVKFDDMVRMDIEYARTWTPWLDFMILLRTPLAVIRGEGAC
jgi:lipopolysaccharide/colanic/teichoic acid biosynthesis glycosyltransferase